MIPSEPQFVAQSIRPRPRNGVVVTVASGQQAGKSYGIDGLSFEIGSDPSSDVLVVDDPGADTRFDTASQTRRLRFERGTSGWSVRDLSGFGFFVNQSYVRSTSELRSGDIVRLTWNGPDVQFILQSSATSLNRLVEQYLPASDVDNNETMLETAALVSELPTHEASQSFSTRETRVLPNANAQATDAERSSAQDATDDSVNDLRKTAHLSRESLAAVLAFQAHKRQARPPVVWLIAAAAFVIVLLLLVFAYLDIVPFLGNKTTNTNPAIHPPSQRLCRFDSFSLRPSFATQVGNIVIHLPSGGLERSDGVYPVRGPRESDVCSSFENRWMKTTRPIRSRG